MAPRYLRRPRALAAAAVLALGVCACSTDGSVAGDRQTPGASSSSPMAGATDHVEADVVFASQMVPHHLQAVEMADLVPTRTKDAEVVELASRIRTAQQPEIDEMTTWLAAWHASPVQGHEAEEHGSHGTMSADAMRELATLRDAAFDRQWLEMMIEHHEGALAMSREVLAAGTHEGTRALATRMIAAQQREVTEMRALLGP